MKLELKHLAPYLPYGLNILYWNGNAKEYVEILQVLHYENRHVLGSDKHKPILRPLSDLATFIIHNEVEFYPLEWIAQELDYDLYSLEYYREHTLRIPYEILSKLLEWHFDIFGLIEKGLAVDINTLKDNHAKQ